MSDATKPYLTTRRAIIRHELMDRASLLFEVFGENIAEALDGQHDARGPVPKRLKEAVEDARNAMWRAYQELGTWAAEAEPVENPAT